MGVISYMGKYIKNGLLIVLLLLCGTTYGQTVYKLSDALDLAAKERKLILAHFWNEGCGPCRLQDARIFSRPEHKARIEKEFVFVKINTRQYGTIKESYSISSVPTEMLILPNGKEIVRFSGSTDAEYYIKEAINQKQIFKNKIRSKKTGNK